MKVTDRELLEWAAKSVGITGSYFWNIDGFGIECADGRVWNPLGSDGDALHLAVLLGLFIDPYGTSTDVAWRERLLSVEHGACPHAATRRAIVCVAAEIGKAMR